MASQGWAMCGTDCCVCVVLNSGDITVPPSSYVQALSFSFTPTHAILVGFLDVQHV